MFCEARVSMDFAHVKELLGEGSPSIGIMISERPGAPAFTRNSKAD